MEQIKQFSIKKGFTVVEMLVSIAILGLVVVSATSIFFVTLKAKNKIKSAMAIKQKGSYALMIMARTIKGAKEVVACLGNRITVVDYDGDQTVFTCDQTNGRILNNGDILVAVDDLVNGQLTGCSFGWDQTVEPNVVTISFTLTAGASETSLDYARQDFQETVSLRKY